MVMAPNLFTLLCVTSIIVNVSVQQSSGELRVETKLGGVVGREKKTLTGKKLYSFNGIPYAKPPVGELRFRPPEPAEPWENDLDNADDLHMCKQNLLGAIMGDEDCLVLHVHTPWNPSTAKLRNPYSVMVFIHGGGFTMGSGSSSLSGNPDYLLEHDVVLVMINYRLGPFGFLSISEENAAGNYGLLDQVAALKWVKDNIASFGGDPDQVTIFGESAGGASVHHLVLSPLAKGLFHRAIAQSGSAISFWATTRIARIHAQALGKKAKCPIHDNSELLECLRKANDTLLTELANLDPTELSEEIMAWPPRIDFDAEDPFLPEHPVKSMESGEYNKVPFLIGFTKDEGATYFTQGEGTTDKIKKQITNQWDQFCRQNMGFKEYMVPKELGSELCEDIRNHYIKDSNDFEKSKMDYIKLLGQSLFVSSIFKSAQLMSRHSPVYMYQLSYESPNVSLFSMLIPGMKKMKGVVSHGDDLLYLFQYPQIKWTRSSPEYEMVEMMSKLWTDFAKTGAPKVPKSNTAWPKSTEDERIYVSLDIQPSINDGYMDDDMDFLDEVFGHYVYNTSVVETHLQYRHTSSSSYSTPSFLCFCFSALYLSIFQ